jgi:SAM-dependent methyltransferase
MLGHLYDRALGPGGRRVPEESDCSGPTIELGCGPARLVARLIQRGIPALGIDRSATAIRLAGRGGAPALLGDVFDASPASGWGYLPLAGECPQPGMGHWQTVLLVDGNVGLGGDPRRILGRAAELLCGGGHCVAEFDAEAGGIRARWVRLESARDVGPWFRWASVGMDSAATLAGQVGLTLTSIRLIGGRVIATLAAS